MKINGDKYSYKDWWEGRISLFYAPLKYREGDILPPHVTWDQIKPDDITKIKEKLKELFDEQLGALFQLWKDTFLNQYKNSKLKEVYLNGEKQQVNDIMFSDIPPGKLLITAHWNDHVFKPSDLQEIQNNIKKVIVQGIALEYDFVHSPHFLFQDDDKIPSEIYAQCCWNYNEWLNEFEETQKEEEPPIEELQTKVRTELENPYPDIFKNGYAYQMFLELKEKVCEKTIAADYGFIFYRMKAENLKAIHPGVRHKAFSEFLEGNFNIKVRNSKLPNKNPAGKQYFYSAILKKYEANILGKKK